MTSVVAFLSRHQVTTFVALTLALSFGAYFLPVPREVVPLLMVCVPALLAVSLAALTEGKESVMSLLRSAVKWRVGLRWLLLPLGLALAMRLAISVLALFLGLIPAIQIRPWTAAQMVALSVLLLIAAALEELGWRGYALPRLLGRRSALFAGLVLGVFWASVHLILLLPGQEFEGMPLLAVALGIVGISVLTTWLFVQTGSVLITSLFHASQNLFVVVNEGIAQADLLWLMAAVQLTAALVLVILAGPDLARPPGTTGFRAKSSMPLPE